MKKFFTWTVMLLVATGSMFAQQIPDKVSSALKAKFSKASDVEWDKSDGNYVAEFMVGETSKSALFTPAGKWIKTVTYAEEDQIPASVKDKLTAKYGEVYYDNVEMVEMAEAKFYHIILSTDNGSYDVEVNPAGKITKETVQTEPEEEYNDDEGDY